MAAIVSNSVVKSAEKKLVKVFGALTVGASGAVSSEVGQLSFVKEGTAGQYSVTSDQAFYRVMAMNVTKVGASISAVCSVSILETPSSLQSDFRSDKTFKVQCVDYAGSAVNPASGEVLMFEVVCQAGEISEQA